MASRGYPLPCTDRMAERLNLFRTVLRTSQNDNKVIAAGSVKKRSIKFAAAVRSKISNFEPEQSVLSRRYPRRERRECNFIN